MEDQNSPDQAPVKPEDLIQGELYYRVDTVTGQRTIDAKFIELVKDELGTYAKFEAGHNATFSDNVILFKIYRAVN
jgi:hypothetical protein